MSTEGRVAFRKLLGALSAAVIAIPAAAQKEQAASGVIYTCTTPDGRKLTSDRPIVECLSREQRMLNRDGSVRGVRPPSLTADERAELEARERAAQAAKLTQQDAARRDRNLAARYPNETAHSKAREAALDTVRVAMKSSENRLRELAAERKPLETEAEFYVGKSVPPKLRQQLEANEVAIEAQRVAIQNQEAELARINKLYDAELERLKKLWAGASPGSLGPLTAAHSTQPPQPPLSRASSSAVR